MKDIDILKQLLNGYHLDPKELKRAKELAYTINNELKKVKECSGVHKTLDELFTCKECEWLTRG